VKFDSPKSASPERTARPALEQEVRSALLNPSERSVDEIDDLLTRCAAETLRLQADRMRTERAFRALEAERRRLLELTGEVRALRDRLTEWSLDS